MSDNLNFKSGLLYLYWLMSGADGSKKFDPNDPEWKTMRLMREHENISDQDFDQFINTDLGNQNEQLSKVIALIEKATHSEKVRALAWMDAVMLADGEIHNKEYDLYTKVRDRFGINEDEIKMDRLTLPKE